MSLTREIVGAAKGFRRPPNSVLLGKVKGSLWRQEWLTEGQLNHHVHMPFIFTWDSFGLLSGGMSRPPHLQVFADSLVGRFWGAYAES